MSEDSGRGDFRPRSLRASDADREQLISELHDHTVAGRLTTEELEERLQAAYSARTTAELDALRDDLPLTPQQIALSHRARRAHLTRRMLQETGGSAGLFVICLVVWLSSGANGEFWPVWVLLIVALSVVRNGWALFGPAPDLDAVERDLDQRREKRLVRDELRARERRRHLDR